MPDLTRLGIVARSKDQEVVAADKLLDTVANRRKALGADVAPNRFLVHLKVGRDLRDRKFFSQLHSASPDEVA